ncbi:hypothetical protein HDU96_004209 [Phlyctochytrium bullatum]|nr:hypothetical protein HDU96_004209 [Phlyctochytrium bullatum]
MDDARAHEEWYQKYAFLLAAKRRAIEKWKRRKEVISPRNSLLNYQAAKSEIEDKLTTKDLQKAEQDFQKVNEEREKKKKMIQSWKEEQKAKKEEAEAQARMLQEKEQDIEEKKKEERLLLKLRVCEYVRDKSEQEAMFRKIAEEEERERRRDEELLKRKADLAEQERLKKEEKEQRLQKLKSTVAVTAKRDPTRILLPTEGFQHRLASPRKNPEEAVHRKFSANHIPKL